MKKELFQLPEGVTYLDGNSLGPLPKSAAERIAETVVEEWGDLLIRGWNDAGWMAQPSVQGDRIGKLIGCPRGSVVVGDTLSIKVYQALSAALKMQPERKVVLSDTGNFPTDLYMAEGLLKTLDDGHEMRTVAPHAVEESLGEDIAVLMLTQVDYRTGRMHDMDRLTGLAQQLGIVVIWDLAHSAGAVPVNMAGCNAEFAVGCTYKFLNAGPGAPAFIYCRPDISENIQPSLCGWLGHEMPFAFEMDYRPAPRIERMRVGTPPIIQLAGLEAALDVWEDVSMEEVRAKSIELSELFIEQVAARCPQLRLASPRDPNMRGSQVSFAFEHGYAAMQALIANGIIGDFRAPDIMRFGITPLYIDRHDIERAVSALEAILRDETWRHPEFQKRAPVT